MLEFGDSRLPPRFWDKVQVAESGCWEWTASTNHGYGYFKMHRKLHRVHRMTYEAWHGEIPISLEIDHLCRNKLCANPTHLEAVSHRENVRRGLNASYARNSATCRLGLHAITPANTRTDLNGKRRCIECKRASQRRYRKRERAKLLAALKGHDND